MTFSGIDSLVDLQYIVIFGIASLFLYLVVPVALFANEVRLAKLSDDTSGTAAIFNSITQAFFYIIAWSVLVSIIFFMVIKLGHGGEKNPAVGVARYWLIKDSTSNSSWLEIDAAGTSTAIGTIVTTTNFPNDDQQGQAKLLIMIIVMGKSLELLLLGVLFALTLKLSFSLPLLKARRTDHYQVNTRMDVGSMMSMFMVGILGFVLFKAIIGFEGVMLSSLLEAGADKANSSGINPVTYITTPPDVDMIDGLKQLLQMGIDAIS